VRIFIFFAFICNSIVALFAKTLTVAFKIIQKMANNLLENGAKNREVDLERADNLLKKVIPNVEIEVFDAPTVEALKEAMELFEKWEEKEKMGEVYEYWGSYEYNRNHFEIAITFHQKSLDIRLGLYEEIHEVIYRIHYKLAMSYTLSNHFEPAKIHLDKALELAKVIFGEQHLDTARSYSVMGFWCFNQDYFVKAIDYFYKCSRILEKLQPIPYSFLGTTYQDIATNYLSVYDYEKAIPFFEKGMTLRKKSLPPMHPSFSLAYSNYAGLYHRMGDINKSILYAQKGIEIGNYNNSVDVVFPYRLLVGIYRNQGRHDKALEFGEKAIEVLVKHKQENHIVNIAVSITISNIYQKRGDYEKALSLIKKSIRIAKELYGEYSAGLASATKTMGEYFIERGMFDEAETYLHKALDILSHCEDDKFGGSSYIYQTLGSLYERTERFGASIKAYHKVFIVSTSGYEEQDVYDYPFFDMKSIDFEIKQEFEFWLRLFSAKAHVFFRFYLMQTNDLKDLKAAFRGYDRTYYFLDQVRDSFQSDQSKLMILKGIGEDLYQAVTTAYTLFEVSQDKYYLDSALEFSEKSKAYLMLSNLQEKNAKQGVSIPIELLEQEKKIRTVLTNSQKSIQHEKQKGEQVNQKRLQELENNYFNNYNKFETLKKQFEIDYPDYYRQKYSTETVSIEVLQKSLEENQTVLSYFIGKEKIFLFVITSNEYEVFPLEKPHNWTILVQNYLQSIKLHQKTKFHQLSFELYQVLLQEAMHHIIDPFAGGDEQRQLFIIPHGELHYLPFETLLIQETAVSESYQELDYLLNYCQISYHYSATLLHLDLQKQVIAEQAPTEITFTGFAPVYDSTSATQQKALDALQNKATTAVNRSEAVRSDGTWMPLPYSKIEVESISQLFEDEGYKSQSFLHNAANKSNLEEQIGKSRFVLIAAHGIVNDDYPELSGLILADDDSGKFASEVRKKMELVDADRGEVELQKATDDCILNMKEVAMIPMSADLVVLSSCESGIGELHKGEGMMAVNRGFLASGAKNVVSTLFKVNDQASSELTQLLFAYILKGENYATALQKAKLDLLKRKGMNPKSWSGFVLFGKGR